MKTKFLKVIILALVTIFTISCSKNDDTSTVDLSIKKPKKWTRINSSGTNFVYLLEYSGNKLTKANLNGSDILFTYNSDNKLIKILEASQTKNLTYTNNNLTKKEGQIIGGLLTIIFSYNNTNQVIKTESYRDLTTLTKTVLYEYDTNSNVKKSASSSETIIRTFDDKNHPFKNVITGLELGILRNEWDGNYINNPITARNATTNYTISYEYDSDNFPTKRILKNANGTIAYTDYYEY
ncbi:hypothetical protein [Flavobacterium psychrophilum]|uniref:hypothetical protein n=1 Tax=Flavobacterium psychrophilum TaxID=96345 RepID=UPI000B7C1945|nr:hypothetical protein [Flavobacterium psychrophilum]MCB6089361.1 hypothetical protein [Flavobacterium psychrophilum]SNA71217.1 exported hypothetical protein [Flavobacterium psychrophilum]